MDDVRFGRVSVLDVADYAANLPRGCAVGLAMGGAMAVTPEQDALWAVEHAVIMSAWLANGGNGKRPKPREYPEGTAAENARRERVIARAKAFSARRSKS